jgi:hypothetical protein
MGLRDIWPRSLAAFGGVRGATLPILSAGVPTL